MAASVPPGVWQAAAIGLTGRADCACRGTGALPNGDACCACGCDDRLVRLQEPQILGSLTFAWEPLAGLLDEGLAAMITGQHWSEVGVHKDQVPVAIDWTKYQKMEDDGLLYLMSARRGETLIGYASYFVMPHLHYCTTLHALNDAIFVVPGQRGAGVRLIQAAERALALVAAPNWIRILYHAKLEVAAERGTFARVFEHLGYKAFETCHDKLVRV